MRTPALLLVSILAVSVASAAEQLRLVTDDWPPYEYRDATTGRVTGFSTELITTILHRLGQPVAPILIYPWARALREVQVANVDGIYTLTLTHRRREFLHFPEEPLHVDSGVIFVRRDRLPSPPVRQVSDLSQMSLAIVRGYAYSPEIRTLLATSSQVTEVTDETQLFSILARERVDAVLTYRNAGDAIVRRMGLEKEIMAITNPILFQRSYYVGFNKEVVSPAFVRQFSDQLRAFKQSPEYRHLERKYFGQPALH